LSLAAYLHVKVKEIFIYCDAYRYEAKSLLANVRRLIVAND
jgi:hypothetical protein